MSVVRREQYTNQQTNTLSCPVLTFAGPYRKECSDDPGGIVVGKELLLQRRVTRRDRQLHVGADAAGPATCLHRQTATPAAAAQRPSRRLDQHRGAAAGRGYGLCGPALLMQGAVRQVTVARRRVSCARPQPEQRTEFAHHQKKPEKLATRRSVFVLDARGLLGLPSPPPVVSLHTSAPGWPSHACTTNQAVARRHTHVKTTIRRSPPAAVAAPMLHGKAEGYWLQQVMITIRWSPLAWLTAIASGFVTNSRTESSIVLFCRSMPCSKRPLSKQPPRKIAPIYREDWRL